MSKIDNFIFLHFQDTFLAYFNMLIPFNQKLQKNNNDYMFFESFGQEFFSKIFWVF
jgi:hypothetical protein